MRQIKLTNKHGREFEIAMVLFVGKLVLGKATEIFRKRAEEALQKEVGIILLNFLCLQRLDAAGIKEIGRLLASSNGKKVIIVSNQREVVDVLAMTKTFDLCRHYESLQEALIKLAEEEN